MSLGAWRRQRLRRQARRAWALGFVEQDTPHPGETPAQPPGKPTGTCSLWPALLLREVARGSWWLSGVEPGARVCAPQQAHTSRALMCGHASNSPTGVHVSVFVFLVYTDVRMGVSQPQVHPWPQDSPAGTCTHVLE